MTSIGGAVQTFVDKYVEPKLKEAKPRTATKERSKDGER